MAIITLNTSIQRITITEDEDLNLDKLLLGDNSGAKLAASTSTPSSRPTSSSASSSPSRHTPANNATAALASAQRCISQNPSPSSPIHAREDEDEGGDGHWIMPAPAQPGDYLNNPLQLQRVPSKSILKKTSSYGNFESMTNSANGSNGSLARRPSSFLPFNMDSSQSSTGSRSRVADCNNALNSSLAGGKPKISKKTSYLSLDLSNSQGSRSQCQQVAIGWDLEDSPASQSPSPSRNRFVPLDASLPSMPSLAADASALDADRAAGLDSSGSRHSGTSSTKIRRNVSFNSVNVREYDRTVGDNPSCRSGPPLSLDWSYSKKYEKNLDDYELERSSERVSLRKLHVNKYRRRNLLAFQWGHTEEEMKAARKSTKKMQRQRSVTQMFLPLQMAEEAFVGLKNVISKKKNNDAQVWSDMSNSASTKDSTQQGGRIFSHQDTMTSSAPSVDNQDLPANAKKVLASAAAKKSLHRRHLTTDYTRRTL